MKYPIMKTAAVLGAIATLMANVADPASARNRWVAPAVGFAAGVAVGAAAANANAYYYDPYYAYNPYAYDPYYGGRVYVAPAYPGNYGYYRPYRSCSDTTAGRIDAGC